MNIKSSVEWELVVETEVLEENPPQWHSVHSNSRVTWSGPTWWETNNYHVSYGTVSEVLILFLASKAPSRSHFERCWNLRGVLHFTHALDVSIIFPFTIRNSEIVMLAFTFRRCGHLSCILLRFQRFWHLNSPLLHHEKFTGFIWVPTGEQYAEFSETLQPQLSRYSNTSVVPIYIQPCLKYLSYLRIYLIDGSRILATSSHASSATWKTDLKPYSFSKVFIVTVMLHTHSLLSM